MDLNRTGWVVLATASAACFLILACCVPLELVDPEKVTDWAAQKAAKLAECEIKGAQTQAERRACLGQFVSDLGTPSCGDAERWLDSGASQ